MERRSCLGVLKQSGLHPVGVTGEDLPGCDRVDENPARTEVDGHLVHEVDHPSLACGVCDMTRRSYHSLLRGDDHNATAHLADRFLLDHLCDRSLGAEEDTAEVDGHDRVPSLLGGFEEALRPAARDAGVTHHHIDATGLGHCVAYEHVDIVSPGGVRNVEAAAVTKVAT